MLPQACEPHLASRILATNLRRLSEDWRVSYGHPVWLAETFVDGGRFRGTCYRASNWIDIGQSRGWSRSGFHYRRNDHPKTVFVYPLVRRAVERLRDTEGGRVVADSQEETMLDVEKLPVQGQGGLIEVLRQIPDPRKRRGIRHSSESVLALAMCAKLCGARSLEAMAQWAEDLPAETLKRLGCRRGRAPSEPTFRRLLGRIDPAELDHRLGEWTAGQTELRGKGLAIDGKTVRGSKDGEHPAVHLVGAVVHGEGLVVAQTRVSDKTNEIKSVEPLLQGRDIEGAVVTGDAMFAQKQIASYLVEQKKADYLFTVKDNQPTLKSDIATLGLEGFPPSGEDTR
jgi:predicted transposase YbfD/YdcC